MRGGLMVSGSRSRDLGDLLERLKVSSGRSYESIGRKIHVSKSTVHRYCTGAAVPREFGVVERLGLVCGASRDDMVLLHRLWLRATTSVDDDVAEFNEDVAADAGHKPSPLGPAHSPPSQHLPTRRRRARALAGVALALCLVVIANSNSSGGPPSIGDGQMPRQWISGPAWTLPPASV